MASLPYRDDVPMEYIEDHQTRHSLSLSSVSSMSAILENVSNTKENYDGGANGHTDVHQSKVPLMHGEEAEEDSLADGTYGDEEKSYRYNGGSKGPSKTTKRVLWIVSAFALGGWLLALFFFLRNGTRTHIGNVPFEHHSDPDKAGSKISTGAGSEKQLTLDSVGSGEWRGRVQAISWIPSPDGRDGMVLEKAGGDGRGALVVEDIRALKNGNPAEGRITLVKQGAFRVDGKFVMPDDYWPSPDLKKVLVMSEKEPTWRHSYTGLYWVVDVATQKIEPLDPGHSEARVQLAQWSPTSDKIVFTRDNNLFVRDAASKSVKQITKDGGQNFFYGIPDWVYEEEVLQNNIGTWFSGDGDYVAFLQTNETLVPEYPLQYFIKHPSETKPRPGEETYPEEKMLKYPRPGSANPVVKVRYYSVKKDQVVDVSIENDLADDDRLITEVVWGDQGRVLIRSTNRESDLLKLNIVDVGKKLGKTVREENIKEIDGGWFEVSQTTKFIPSDPEKGRAHSGYIDTIFHEGYEHLGYFTPLDNPKPIVLTSGKWEVVNAPSAVDLEAGLVYFVAAKRGPGARHVYSVKLDGTDLQALPGADEEKDGYWSVSFSSGANFALLNYQGPGIPNQKVVSTPSNKKESNFQHDLEQNEDLSKKAAAYDLPDRTYSLISANGVQIPTVELRPKHFDKNKKYPVLLAPYGGPNSQMVNKVWNIDFHSYLAATLGYIVVIADGRGTGLMGRDFRTGIRGYLGKVEGEDQIAVAKEWASRPYIDSNRVAIWGWSYGGFLTLKTLELDGGQTFSYGMAVAPVTDWRYYDSIYTERYMFTPEHNKQGYDNSSIHDVWSLAKTTRFLMIHGTADDNVHYQNSMQLLDKLDLAEVRNFDFHSYPDSDHSIYFHNARKMVYQRLNDWLINAFNGEYHELNDPKPHNNIDVE